MREGRRGLRMGGGGWVGGSIGLEGACEEAIEDREERSDVDGPRVCHTK